MKCKIEMLPFFLVMIMSTIILLITQKKSCMWQTLNFFTCALVEPIPKNANKMQKGKTRTDTDSSGQQQNETDKNWQKRTEIDRKDRNGQRLTEIDRNGQQHTEIDRNIQKRTEKEKIYWQKRTETNRQGEKRKGLESLF